MSATLLMGMSFAALSARMMATTDGGGGALPCVTAGRGCSICTAMLKGKGMAASARLSSRFAHCLLSAMIAEDHLTNSTA